MTICRIGVFYDGNYFMYAQRHYHHKRSLGWLNYQAFHQLIESFVREKEQQFVAHRVVYASWHQGMFSSPNSTEKQLRGDRNRDHDLMHAGIEAKYVPMNAAATKEKGVDVALAVDAMQIALSEKIDVAVIVTGDGDFVPLVRAIMKQGVRVAIVHFEYEDEGDKTFISERLRVACNYALNVSDMERDRSKDALFRGLFRRVDKTPDANGA